MFTIFTARFRIQINNWLLNVSIKRRGIVQGTLALREDHLFLKETRANFLTITRKREETRPVSIRQFCIFGEHDHVRIRDLATFQLDPLRPDSPLTLQHIPGQSVRIFREKGSDFNAKNHKIRPDFGSSRSPNFPGSWYTPWHLRVRHFSLHAARIFGHGASEPAFRLDPSRVPQARLIGGSI